MTRAEMVTEYNFWVRKRECYKEKIATNSSIRTTLSNGFYECESYSASIGNYSDEAVLFGDLYEKVSASFNSNVTSDILTTIDEVGEHLEGVKSYAQERINYYDQLIKDYDAEQERQERERQERERQESQQH